MARTFIAGQVEDEDVVSVCVPPTGVVESDAERHPHSLQGGTATMTPESSEGRERIVRLESRIQDVAEDVARNERTFGPLPLAVERLQWTIDAINNRLDKRDIEEAERFEKLARSFENQVIACKGSVDEVVKEQRRQSEVFLEWQEKERNRREDLAKTEKQDQTTDKTSRRAMWALIGAAAVTGVLGLITQLVTALS